MTPVFSHGAFAGSPVSTVRTGDQVRKEAVHPDMPSTGCACEGSTCFKYPNASSLPSPSASLFSAGCSSAAHCFVLSAQLCFRSPSSACGLMRENIRGMPLPHKEERTWSAAASEPPFAALPFSIRTTCQALLMSRKSLLSYLSLALHI